MHCPNCASCEVLVEAYDFGVCRQTGYHDAGEAFRCAACGEVGDAGDAMQPEQSGVASGTWVDVAGLVPIGSS